MKSVGLFEAKSHFSEIILAVEGQSIIVTKKGKQVARSVPFVDQERPHEIGFDDGKIWIADDFNELGGAAGSLRRFVNFYSTRRPCFGSSASRRKSSRVIERRSSTRTTYTCLRYRRGK